MASHTRTVRALSQVRWVGGGSGAGKTTLAQRLSDRYGVRVYSCDETIRAHSAALGAAAAPLLDGFRRMSMDQRWVRRDPQTMYASFPWFQGEGFDLIIEDLRTLPPDEVVVAEGFRLLPHLIRPYLTDPRHAVWLIPTPAFRRDAFTRRDAREAFWRRTSDPHRALANLLDRDRIFTDAVAADANHNGLATIVMDGNRTAENLAEDLADRFDLKA